MNIRQKALLALYLCSGVLFVGCSSPEQKPLTQEDKAKMMDRSDVPKGYLEATKQRMGGAPGAPGQPGPVSPPAAGTGQ